MLAVSTTTWWIIGWAAGGAVVLVAAGLLLAIDALARRVERQADEIRATLEGVRANTDRLGELTHATLALGRTTEALTAVREGLDGK